MKKIQLIFLSFLFCSLIFSCYDENDTLSQPSVIIADDGTVLPGETGSRLQEDLATYFSALDNLVYNDARDQLYAYVSLNDANQLETIYTGVLVTIDPTQDGTDQADNNNVNAEHVVPQSLFSQKEPMVSDMHHLFPSLVNVNSARSNFAFGEFNDTQTAKWFKDNQSVSTDPDISVESSDYSRLSTSNIFQPRDSKKGDIARACLYFYTVYRNNSSAGPAVTFIQNMLPTLLKWNKQDPVDDFERLRNQRIYEKQYNYNPFILDETVVDRLYQ